MYTFAPFARRVEAIIRPIPLDPPAWKRVSEEAASGQGRGRGREENEPVTTATTPLRLNICEALRAERSGLMLVIVGSAEEEKRRRRRERDESGGEEGSVVWKLDGRAGGGCVAVERC
jgi:hypothetical protein